MAEASRVAKNSLFLFLLTMSNYAIGLLLYPYLSRVLSIEKFGLFGFALSFSLLFQVIVEFGFTLSATAEISQNRHDREKVSEVVAVVFQAKILLFAVAGVVLLVCSYAIPMVSSNFAIVALFCVDAGIKALLPDFFYRGIENMGPIMVRTVSVRVLMILFIVLTVKGDTQLILVPVGFIIGDVVALALSTAGVYRRGARMVLVSPAKTFRGLWDGSLFFASRAAVSLNQSLATLILGTASGPSSVNMGLFTGAYRISSAGERLVPTVTDSLYPHMVKTKDYKLLYRVAIGGGLLWFAGCATVFVFADQICRFILGENFYDGGALLRVFVVGVFISFFTNLFGYPALVPLGLSKHANLSVVFSSMVCAGVYLVLVLTGAVTPVALTMVVASAPAVTLLYRGVVLLVARFRGRSATSA